MTEIPAVVKEVSDQESRKQAIIENLQRSNLNPIEEAKAYRSLINELAYSHEELAKAMGKSRPYISNALRPPTSQRDTDEYRKWQTDSRTC